MVDVIGIGKVVADGSQAGLDVGNIELSALSTSDEDDGKMNLGKRKQMMIQSAELIIHTYAYRHINILPKVSQLSLFL